MKMEIFSAIPFYYGAAKEAPNTVRVWFTLKDTVSGEILKNAVKESMKRYPYLGVKVVSDGDCLSLEENFRELAVTEGIEPVCLGSEEANGHLLALTYSGNRISFDFFHGLADGGGIYPFLHTVLYYYCKERYDKNLDSAGVRLAGEPIPAEEIEDPYPEEVPDTIVPIGKAGRKTALNLLKAGKCSPGTSVLHKIRIPESAYMAYSKSKDGSPAAITALLMARAVDAVHPREDKPIICGLAMNIRSMLGKPMAHHSAVSQLFLEYKEEMKHMDLLTQATCFRGMVMVQGQYENVMDSVRNNLKFFQRVKAQPDIESKRQITQQLVSAFLDVSTFKVSYVGKSNMGAVEPYLKDIYVDIDLNGSGIMIEVNAVNGWFNLSFQQEWEEDVYLQAFMEQLEKEGIQFEYEGSEQVRLPSIAFNGK